METKSLREAYAQVIDEARTGTFGPPPEGEWSALHVIAHIATNDEIVAGIAEQALAGQHLPFYNHDAVDTAGLTERIKTFDGLAALTDWLTETSARVCALTEQLPGDDTMVVHVHLEDGGKVRHDAPMPWSALVHHQTHVHLPAHLRQLRALRVETPES